MQLSTLLLTEMSPTLGKPRKYMTPYQTQILLWRYETNPYIKKEEKHQLAHLLNISEERIKDWFEERRKRQRKSGIFRDGE